MCEEQDTEIPKVMQGQVLSTEGDPVYMTLEEDGQEAFDKMWEEGQTITPNGYV